MVTAFAGTSETVVKLIGLAVTMSGNRGRDRDGEVAVRGNLNLRLGTLAPFCTGSLQCQPTGLPCAEFEKFSDSSTNARCLMRRSPPHWASPRARWRTIWPLPRTPG